MTVAATTSPTPGWYPDPHDTSTLRWWDGAGWTDFTSPALPAEPEAAALSFESPFTATTTEPVASPEPDKLPSGVQWVGYLPKAVLVEELVEPEPYELEPEAAPEPRVHAPEPPPQEAFSLGVVLVEPEPAPEPEAAFVFEAPSPAPEPFSFRARPLVVEEPPEPVEYELPVYTSPLATIASPVPEKVAAPDHVATSSAPPAASAAQPEPEPEPEPQPAALEHEPASRVVSEPEDAEPVGAESPKRSRRGRKKAPAAVAPPAFEAPAPVEHRPKRSRRPSRKAAVGAAAVVVAAAGAAGATNLITGDGSVAGDSTRAGSGQGAAVAVDKACLQEWNTSIGGDAAQQRVTLGQFSGALARVARVSPLPGTLMDPQSCGLTVYDPSADTNAVFVSGVKDHVGYMDVTGYPRAARQYGWPKSASETNVVIQDDGSLRVKTS